MAVIAVKTARDQHTPPMTFGTSKRVHDFFQLSLGNTMEDVSASFEAYALSGVSGTRSILAFYFLEHYSLICCCRPG